MPGAVGWRARQPGLTMAGNDAPVTFSNAIGIMPICVKRIESGTAAGAIIALY